MSSGEWDLPTEPLDPALLAETLDALADRLAAQEELAAAVIGRLGRDESPTGRWSWRHLTAEQSTVLTEELRDWVGWLVERYQLGQSRHQVPDCWEQHPVAVEELTALMVSWQAAYAGADKAPSDALIAWHDRWLWPCLARLNEGLQVWNGCRAGRHAETR